MSIATRSLLSRKILLPILFAALIAPLPGNAAEMLSAQKIKEINELSAATMAKDGLPSLSIAVSKGTEVWSAGYGKADLEQDVAADTHSLYRVASVSKWFTSTAALRLVEAGKLNLDVPIQNYCPQFPKKQATITTRLLLSHLAGFRNYYSSGANREPRNTEEERRALAELISREESMQFIRYTDVIKPLDAFKNETLLFDPGTHFHYTSLSYRVLSCVIEGAAQTPYRTVMRDLVFTPAGMKTIVEDDALAITPHRVAGYARGPNKTFMRAPYRDVSENIAAGGYLSSAEDLVRFAIAFNTDKLVKAATREQMIARPKLGDGSEVPLTLGSYYGMGIFVRATNDEFSLMHTGAQNGTTTELIVWPKTGISVAVMTNIDGWGLGRDVLARKIAEIVGREK